MFVERARALLKEKGIPAKVMLQDLEINKNQLTRWEKDGTVPHKALLIAIANYLDTTVEYLTGESDEKEKTPEPLDPDHNVLIMRGRDGSYIRKQLTDEEVRALAVLVSQMKDAPDDI